MAVCPLPVASRSVQLVVELERNLEPAVVEEVRAAHQHLRLHDLSEFLERYRGLPQLFALGLGEPHGRADHESIVGHPQIDGGATEAPCGGHRPRDLAQHLVQRVVTADLRARG